VKIVGVGGGGSNAVNRMVEAGVQGVEFIAVNTDAQALQMSSAMRKIPIGGRNTRGLGAGGDPQQGERAAEISRDALTSAIAGADMVFLTAGLGGGTGDGPTELAAWIDWLFIAFPSTVKPSDRLVRYFRRTVKIWWDYALNYPHTHRNGEFQMNYEAANEETYEPEVVLEGVDEDGFAVYSGVKL
jgi:hypothetical protein